MQETVQEKAPERLAQAGQLKVSTGTASAPPFVDNRPSTAAQLKLAQMAHSAPKVVAQRRQMGVINGATAQLEEEDEPLQGKAEPLQAKAEPLQAQAEALPAKAEPLQAKAEPLPAKAEPVQMAQAQEAPVAAAAATATADAPQQVEPEPMQLKAEPVRQYAFRRTWGDEEPAKAEAAPAAEQVAEPEAAAAQAPAQKPGFFGRLKNGIKNVAGKVGRALLNWSGQGKPPAGAAAAKPQRPGAQPAPVQAPAGPKVYVPNEKRVGARRVQSRAPITGRAAAVEKSRADMTKGMLGNASLDAVSAETKLANSPNAPAAAAADPAAMVAGVIENRMRSSAPGLMRQGLSTKMGPLAAAEEGAVAGKLTANSYAVGGKAYKGEEYAGAAAKAANAAAKQNGA